MSEMSDRVKLALQEEALRLAMALGKDWRFKNSSFEALARAALKAMREPTEGMIRSALGYENRQLVQGVYRAMVDEALR